MKKISQLKKYVNKYQITEFYNLVITDPQGRSLYSDGKFMLWDPGFDFDITPDYKREAIKPLPKLCTLEAIALPNYKRILSDPVGTPFEFSPTVLKAFKNVYGKNSEHPFLHFNDKGITIDTEEDRQGNLYCTMTDATETYPVDMIFNVFYLSSLDIVRGQLDADKYRMYFETKQGEVGILQGMRRDS